MVTKLSGNLHLNYFNFTDLMARNWTTVKPEKSKMPVHGVTDVQQQEGQKTLKWNNTIKHELTIPTYANNHTCLR